MVLVLTHKQIVRSVKNVTRTYTVMGLRQSAKHNKMRHLFFFCTHDFHITTLLCNCKCNCAANRERLNAPVLYVFRSIGPVHYLVLA
jgi:hypothetical protein